MNIKSNIINWQTLNLELVDGLGLLDDVFWYMDPADKTLHLSGSWQKISGYTPDDMKKAKDYLNIVHPHDVLHLTCRLRNLANMLDDSLSVLHRIICKSGNICNVLLKIRRLKHGNGLEIYAGTLTDRLKEYNPIIINVQMQHAMMAERLRHALLTEQFFIVYQPQYDVNTGKINGLEALLRWKDSTGIVMPLDFIPVAEASGLIIPIGHWVLKQVCNQLVIWNKQCLQIVPVAVNISSTQFLAPGFLDSIRQLLIETCVDPSLLELEITESLYMDTSKDAKLLLSQLRQIGIRIVLDDFGAGYSSLTYIKHFKLDRLKIDRSFIHGIQSNSVDSAIVNTIIMLAEVLQLSVIAEGVETLAQYEFLKKNGCNSVQGFYFSRPIEAEQVAQLIC